MNWKKVSLTLLAFALLAPCLPVYAQSPPRPPVFIEDNYDLAAAIAQVPFNVSLPAEPVITSEVICTTEAEITASLAVNGRRTIIAPGTYNFGSAITIGGNNKLIEFQPGASMSLPQLNITNASAVKMVGANISTTPVDFGLNVQTSQDIWFERLTFTSNNRGFYGVSSNSRILFLSSSVTVLYSAGATGNIDDFIVANSQFISTTPVGTSNGWAMRWWGSSHNRSVFMDSRFRAEENTCLRYEGATTNGYFARNQIEGTSSFRNRFGDGDTYTTNGLWFIDNNLYPTSGGWPNGVTMNGYPNTLNLTATGNRAYAESSFNANLGFQSGQPTWTLSDNALVHTAWPSTPPVWQMR